jgi:hypothetical protein
MRAGKRFGLSAIEKLRRPSELAALIRHWPLACENACRANFRKGSYCHGSFGLNVAEG